MTDLARGERARQPAVGEQIAPRVARVAIMWNPSSGARQFQDFEAAARTLKLDSARGTRQNRQNPDRERIDIATVALPGVEG